MNFFDAAYDEMSWQEISFRLPGELAISAIKRRIVDLGTLQLFFENGGGGKVRPNPIKEHINNIIDNAKLDDVLDTFQNEHRTLFSWLNKKNIESIKSHNPNSIDIKLLFNSTESDDKDGLIVITKRILDEQYADQNHIHSVLKKADNILLPTLVNMLLKDKRLEVRACVLRVASFVSTNIISNHQLIIALKAFSRIDNDRPVNAIGVLDFKLFTNLRPMERINALEKYFGYFPKYRKTSVFKVAPTEEEFKMILFAGCLKHYDKVNKLNQTYKDITQNKAPKESR